MPTCKVVVGAQWGDEGKGKIVDMLSETCDVVARCQGGNNAGHTVVVNGKHYFFHLVPSGILRKETLCVIGNGVVIHLRDFFEEVDVLTQQGVQDIENRLRVSERAHIVFDVHREIDVLEELARGKSLIGTTKRGIGPTYSSKVARRGLRIGDLVGNWDVFCERYENLVMFYKSQFPNLKVDVVGDLAVIEVYRERLRPMVRDTVYLLNKMLDVQTHSVLVECAQSTMLDIDFGTYPYVTSSNCSIGGVCTGLGLAPARIGDVFGVAKAYTTRVGSGAFPTEIVGDLAEKLQRIGGEFGVTTGRKRRVGWYDAVVIRYANMINQFTCLALTKLDILDDFDEIKIGKEYIDPETGQTLPCLPSDMDVFSRVQVVYETLPGWKTCTTGIEKYSDLPHNAIKYIEAVERASGVLIRWVGIGHGRMDIIAKPIS